MPPQKRGGAMTAAGPVSPGGGCILDAGDVERLADICRTLAQVGAARPHDMRREEVAGEVIDCWCRLRNVLMWRLPDADFAALDV
jgi:hypothetical protein